jgi:hypothetical protein
MKNFKVVKINAVDGAYQLLGAGLSEMGAWEYATRMEEKQFQQKTRSAWYAVTDRADWQSMAAAFYKMRSWERNP